jgi:general secretion pathway protein B
MSFILEALKRADRERRLERAPDLSSVYEESNLPRHTNIRPWLWLCGSFLVVAIVVGLMLWPEGPGPVKSPLPKDESASPPLSAPETIEKTPRPSFAKGGKGLQAKRPSAETSDTQPIPGLLRKAKPVRPITSVTKKMASVKSKSLLAQKEPGPKPVSTSRKISEPRPGSVAAVKKREPVQPSPSVSLSPEKASKEPAASDQEKAVEKQTEAVAVSPSKPPPTSAAKEQVNMKRIEAIPLVSKLPYEIKEKLGKLQINVHSYSKDPAERLVFINMHSYKVGDKIGEGGPLLKEITPDGVIIDYGEGEARLQVGR